MIDEHTFVDAHYANNDRTSLKTLWRSPDGQTVRPYYIDVENDPDVFKKFLNNTKRWADDQSELVPVTEDWLVERTYEYIKSSRREYEKKLVDIAKRSNEYMSIINEHGLVNHTLLLRWLNESTDKTEKEIFSLKLKMFEMEHVLNSDNRDAKAKLRKAQTLKDTLLYYLQV